jgi:hypothetical protein
MIITSLAILLGNYFITTKSIPQIGSIYRFQKRLSGLSDIAG